jgi:hypothetical protein
MTKVTTPQAVTQIFVEKIRCGDEGHLVSLIEMVHPATRRAIVEIEARNNLECYQNQWCLEGMLREEGYTILDISMLRRNQLARTNDVGTNRKVGSSNENDIKQYRLAALQRLALGKSTLQEENAEAKRKVQGGTFLDFVEIDISLAWKLAQELLLHELVKAEKVHNASPEMLKTWEAICNADSSQMKRITRELAGNLRTFPAVGDKLDPRQIWPMLKSIGFKSSKCGQTRAEGKIWSIEPIQY